MENNNPRPTNQEIVVVHRSEEKPRGRWDGLEQTAKILSIVAIPVILAIVGWKVQDSLSQRNVSQEYVSLAVSILKEREVDPGLRSWAVDLLNGNSPTQFAPEVAQRLKEGVLRLPVSAVLQQAMKDVDIETIVSEILSAAGIVPNFTLVASNSIPTVLATMKDGKRILVYNPTFILTLNYNSGTHWAAVAVLAHEIGHHLMGHLLSESATNAKKSLEVEADYFSGFMLSRLGASDDEVTAVFQRLPEESQSFYYRDRAERVKSARLGWQKAQAGGAIGKP